MQISCKSFSCQRGASDNARELCFWQNKGCAQYDWGYSAVSFCPSVLVMGRLWSIFLDNKLLSQSKSSVVIDLV